MKRYVYKQACEEYKEYYRINHYVSGLRYDLYAIVNDGTVIEVYGKCHTPGSWTQLPDGSNIVWLSCTDIKDYTIDGITLYTQLYNGYLSFNDLIRKIKSYER